MMVISSKKMPIFLKNHNNDNFLPLFFIFCVWFGGEFGENPNLFGVSSISICKIVLN